MSDDSYELVTLVSRTQAEDLDRGLDDREEYHPLPHPQKWLTVRFRFYELHPRSNLPGEYLFNLLREQVFRRASELVLFIVKSGLRSCHWRENLTRHLSILGVPADKQFDIIEKIFDHVSELWDPAVSFEVYPDAEIQVTVAAVPPGLVRPLSAAGGIDHVLAMDTFRPSDHNWATNNDDSYGIVTHVSHSHTREAEESDQGLDGEFRRQKSLEFAVRFKFYKLCTTTTSNGPGEYFYNLLSEQVFRKTTDLAPFNDYDYGGFLRSSRWRETLSRQLSIMGVPADKHPGIIREIFDDMHELLFRDLRIYPDPEAEIQVTVAAVPPGLVRLDGTDIVLDRAITESLQTYKPRLTPAAKSFIEGLEKVRVTSNLEELEAVIGRKSSCVICLESLLDDDGYGDGDDHQQGIDITRLPCLHHYHGDCIVQWLQSTHICPVCRYAMPTVEDEPSDSKRRRLS